MYKGYLWSFFLCGLPTLCLEFQGLNMEMADEYGLDDKDNRVYRTKVMMYLLRL